MSDRVTHPSQSEAGSYDVTDAGTQQPSSEGSVAEGEGAVNALGCVGGILQPGLRKQGRAGHSRAATGNDGSIKAT